MAGPSARKGLLPRSAIDTQLAPPACLAAPERPRIDVSLAQRGPWSLGRHVPRKVAILPGEVAIAARNYRPSFVEVLAGYPLNTTARQPLNRGTALVSLEQTFTAI